MSKQVGDVFSKSGDTVQQGGLRGETVGDLKNLYGMSDAQIRGLGPTKPTAGVQATRGILRGLGQSFGSAQQQPVPQGGGMPADFNIQGTQLPDAYYQNLNPQQQRSHALFGY